MLAYTGLETVANLAEETRRPGVQLPKSLFAGIGAVVAVYVAIAFVGLMAFPVPRRRDRARDDVGGRAADGDRRRARPAPAGLAARPAARSTSASRARSSCCSRRPRRSPASGGSPTRSASTASCRARSDACTGARSSSPQAVFAAVGISAGIIIAVSPLERPLLVPREPLQLRRPARVHRGAARRDPAAADRAEPPAAVQGPVQRERSRRRGSRAVGRRRDRDVRRLDRGAVDASGRAVRRPGVAARRPRRLRARAARARRRAARARRVDGRAGRSGGDVREHPRADEARRHRRGDGRDRGQARAGERLARRRAARDQGAARPAARRADGATRRSAPRSRSTRRRRSARTTASRCAASSSGRARSATRS